MRYYYDNIQINSGAVTHVNGTNQAQAVVANSLSNSGATYLLNGDFTVTAHSNSSFFMRGKASYVTSAGVTINMDVGIQFGTVSVNALRLLMSAGNITGTAHRRRDRRGRRRRERPEAREGPGRANPD